MGTEKQNSISCRVLLANNMKLLRSALGFSQMSLSHRVNCSTTFIANIETLKRFPSAENLDRIANALGVHVYQLFMQFSPAVEKAVEISEVREKLGQKVLEVIQDVLSEIK